MLKTTLFIGVLLALMVALQPSFFAGLVGIKSAENNPIPNQEASPSPQSLQEAAQGANSEPNGVQKKLVAADIEDLSPAQGQTQYAQGYSKDNFGKAYDAPEDMFPDAPKDKTQLEGIWKTLMEATYNIKYDERLDDMVFIPVFTKEIKGLENKEIELKGYILPHDITKMDKSGNKGNMFMFSAFPAQSCFFCGAAGPESIVEVNPKKPIPYSKSAVKIKGKLRLNTTDFLRMFYILEDAKLSE